MDYKHVLLYTGLLFAAGVLTLVLPHAAQAGAGKRARKHLLVVTVTTGFHHDSIPTAETVIKELGDRTGDWDTDYARTDEHASDAEKAAVLKEKLSPEALQHYDAVVFANTTGVLPLPDPQAFLDYIRAGHGFAAMHSGADTFHEWPGQTGGVSAYVQMLGGEFLTHHSQCAVDAHIDDPNFPANKPLEAAARHEAGANPPSIESLQQGHSVVTDRTWHVFDEIYLFKNNDRTQVHVLLSLNKHPNDGSPEANQPGDYLLAWDKAYGKGRVFYTALGHRKEVWNDPLYQQHILGGIRFALGLAKGSTTPSPPLNSR